VKKESKTPHLAASNYIPSNRWTLSKKVFTQGSGLRVDRVAVHSTAVGA
jgi:hypothetical protein